MNLHPAEQKMILHWGEMGTRWGINRTVAQIHALLYLSTQPLHAEELSETLQVARSNISTSLRELQSWGLVRSVNKLGDRRDYFTTEKNVWELFRVVMAERKKREIDPTLTVLREVCMELESDPESDPEHQTRLAELLDFVETTTTAYEQINRLPTRTLIRLVRMADKLRWILGEGEKEPTP